MLYTNKLRMGLCFLIIQLCGTGCSNIAQDQLNDNGLGHVQYQDQLVHPLMMPNQKLQFLRQYPVILPNNLGIHQENMFQHQNLKKNIPTEPQDLATDEQHDPVKAKPVQTQNVDIGNRCPYGGCGLRQSSYGWNGWQYPGYNQRSYSYIPQMREPCYGCNKHSARRSADVSSEVPEEEDLEESNEKPTSFRSLAHGRQYRGKYLHPNFRMDSNVDQGMLDFDYDNDDSISDNHN